MLLLRIGTGRVVVVVGTPEVGDVGTFGGGGRIDVFAETELGGMGSAHVS
jgi:hypothetical protein